MTVSKLEAKDNRSYQTLFLHSNWKYLKWQNICFHQKKTSDSVLTDEGESKKMTYEIEFTDEAIYNLHGIISLFDTRQSPYTLKL